MKRLLSIIAVLLLINTLVICGNAIISRNIFPAAYAEDEDLWGNFNTDFSSPKEQRFVSDEEFEAALKKKNKKVDKWKNILLNNNGKPRGEERYQSNESEAISKGQGEDSSLPVISLPVEIQIGEYYVPVGHYQIEGKNDNGKIMLNFYQANNLIARIPAVETNDDFEQEEILFANWLPQGENSIKIIYGSLDFNAYAIVGIK